MTHKTTQIVAAFSNVNGIDGAGKTQFDQCISQLSCHDIIPQTLTIDPLSTPWFSPIAQQHFRSGCAPLMALSSAYKSINAGAKAVVIQGREPLNSGYTREQRHELMAVYDGDLSIADLYDQLAHRFIEQQHSTTAQFLELAKQLQQNYQTTYQQYIDDGTAHFSLPSAKWRHHVTPLFRGVDCANPLIDFSGYVLLCDEETAKLLTPDHQVSLAGIGVNTLVTGSEPTALNEIAQYQHLQQAFNNACQQANIDFVAEFTQGNALLEAYTCYPVVPMAFLLCNGFVSSLDQLPQFLQQHSITVTGGMNLARAPWNNPSLNALITTFEQLRHSEQRYAMIHGNGGLGYRQGVAVLHKN